MPYTALALVASSIILTTGLFLGDRYQISSTGQAVYRIDRITGVVSLCMARESKRLLSDKEFLSSKPKVLSDEDVFGGLHYRVACWTQ